MKIKYEIIEFEHKGVRVDIELNYETSRATFVEFDDLADFWKPKRYLFAARGVEYLGGWVLIFEALQEATKLADEKLREQEAIRDKEATDKAIDLMVALSEDKSD